MTLTKYKLGELIEESFRKNSSLQYGIEYVRGISNNKEIQQTKADVDESVINKFYIVYPGEFVYNPRTTRMGDKVGLGYNDTDYPLLFSFNNIAFFIKKSAKTLILPEYLFMYFRRSEFDRYAIINSWGSATELFSFDELCDIEIDLPLIDIQKKYVAIYNSLLENQKSYERGLEDLKLVCDAYIEDLRRKIPSEPIGQYITTVNESNSNYQYDFVQGVESSGSFMDTRANMQDVDTAKYTVVRRGDIAYNPSRINIGSIAIYTGETPCIVSPMYVVFKVIDTGSLLPEYLMLWLRRKEFARHTWFYAAGSVRDTFDYSFMEEVEIPIPSIEIQKSIVSISQTLIGRGSINKKLKDQIKDICPILIKGSIDEGR